MGCVYIVRNSIDGKVYVGRTMRTMERRKYEHLYYSKKGKTYFQRALKKYGFGNFEWLVAFESDDEKELAEKESLLISEYESHDANKGYNIIRHHAPCSQLPNKRKGHPCPWKGRHPGWSIENNFKEWQANPNRARDVQKWKERSAARNKDPEMRLRNREGVLRYMQEHPERKEQLYQSMMKGMKKPRPISAMDTRTNETFIFKSIKNASEELKIDRRLISEHLKNGKPIHYLIFKNHESSN